MVISRTSLPCVAQWILVLIFSSLLYLGSAVQNGLDIPDFEKGRIFMVSTTAPIARILNSNSRILSLTERLISFFNEMDSALQDSLAASNGNITRTTDHFPVCNNEVDAWRGAVQWFIRAHGWPMHTFPQCVTNIFGIPSGVSIGTEAALRQLIISRALAASRFAARLANEIMRNWTEPVYPMLHMYKEDSMECMVDNLVAVRIHGVWYLTIRYTNQEQTKRLEDFKRAYVVESHTVQDGRLEAKDMRLPIHPGVGTVHKIADNATTVVTRWAGRAEPSSFMPEALKNNIAVRDAINKGEKYRDEIGDSISASNIAIRVLPLMLNLIPLAAFTESGGVAMVVYAISSDIVTAIPLGIKGIELVSVSQKRFVSGITRMGDVSSGLDTSIAAETWVAECRIRNGLGLTGISFIVISVGMMCLGIGLEVVSYKRTQRTRRAHESESSEEEGQALMSMEDHVEDDETISLRTRYDEHRQYTTVHTVDTLHTMTIP